MKGYIARYSIELKGRIYAKSYGFLSFPKNMEKNLSIKYGQKLLDTKKKLATDALKSASKRAIQKTAKATGDLVGNKITRKLQRPPQKVLVRIQKNLHNQQRFLRKYTYHQENGDKLVMNFNYYDYKYIARMECQDHKFV